MHQSSGPGSRSNSLEHGCNYSLIDFEFRWGLSQVEFVSEVNFHCNLHYQGDRSSSLSSSILSFTSQVKYWLWREDSEFYISRNICLSTIYITARGAWKLGGLEHSGEWRSVLKLELDSTLSQSWIEFWNWIFKLNIRNLIKNYPVLQVRSAE